jgi:lipoprotein-anchoring transpeptidase ErfK/SrfK
MPSAAFTVILRWKSTGSIKEVAMRILIMFAVLIVGPLWASAAQSATIIARVDKSSQTMTVYHHGEVIGRWQVSTARAGKVTPSGSWTAKSMKRYHRSSRYNNAPMPYSIFYSGHFAIHGTNQIKRLGRPASAGCIRLHPGNAAKLFSLVQSEGLGNMKVVVVD